MQDRIFRPIAAALISAAKAVTSDTVRQAVDGADVAGSGRVFFARSRNIPASMRAHGTRGAASL